GLTRIRRKAKLGRSRETVGGESPVPASFGFPIRDLLGRIANETRSLQRSRPAFSTLTRGLGGTAGGAKCHCIGLRPGRPSGSQVRPGWHPLCRRSRSR